MQLKRFAQSLWLLQLIALWFLSGQNWFSVTVESKTYLVTGQQAFAFLSGILWLGTLSLLASFVLRKLVSIIIVAANILLALLASATLLTAASGEVPASVIEFVAKQTGVTGDFATTTLPYFGISIGLAISLIPSQSLLSWALLKAPTKPKRYESEVKRDANDPISLWDSQA